MKSLSVGADLAWRIAAMEAGAEGLRYPSLLSLKHIIFLCIIGEKNMKKSRKPNGKNIEIALELLELSLSLKTAVEKAMKKK